MYDYSFVLRLLPFCLAVFVKLGADLTGCKLCTGVSFCMQVLAFVSIHIVHSHFFHQQIQYAVRDELNFKIVCKK